MPLYLQTTHSVQVAQHVQCTFRKNAASSHARIHLEMDRQRLSGGGFDEFAGIVVVGDAERNAPAIASCDAGCGDIAKHQHATFYASSPEFESLFQRRKCKPVGSFFLEDLRHMHRAMTVGIVFDDTQHMGLSPAPSPGRRDSCPVRDARSISSHVERPNCSTETLFVFLHDKTIARFRGRSTTGCLRIHGLQACRSAVWTEYANVAIDKDRVLRIVAV